MKDSIIVDWTGGMSFTSEINGHKLVVDAKEEFGGKNLGPRPKALMMLALAGCTGMDVVSILEKMRVKIDDLAIKIESELNDDHPKFYTKMHIIYQFKGEELELDKLQKAVDLSQEKYCGVSANYKKAMDVSYEIKIIK
jgi:putative redox protein